MVKRVLFLMSDTGGGHRAAAEAIEAALYQRYGEDAVAVDMIDVFKQTLFPLNYMPEFYPWLISRSKSSWGLGYNISNTQRRARMLSRGMYLTNGYRLRKMVREYSAADVVVCVHSVIARPSLSAFQTLDYRPPFITVVTDLITTHMFWYDRRVERCLVPTESAFERGLECNLDPDQMRITGLPVHPRFSNFDQTDEEARAEMGWLPGVPTVLMVSGGEGMGPVYDIARAINDEHLNCQLVIVTGRNKLLKNRLEASHWNQPTHIYGFMRNMPQLMAAADVLVTKAGPATISEACIAGLPMIISDAIPGQETGNVDYVVQNGAGVYAPGPEAVASALRGWLAEGRAGLQRRSENAAKLGMPNAVWDIAEEVWQYAHQPPIQNQRRTILDDLLEAPAEIFPTLT